MLSKPLKHLLLVSAATALAIAAWAQAKPAFDQIVTEAVVAEAASKTAKYMSDWKADEGEDAVTMTAGYEARNVAFTAYPGLGKTYNPELRKGVMEAVRAHLKSPQNLNAAYTKFKPVALGKVKGMPGAEKLAAAIDHVMPAFEGKGAVFTTPQFRTYADVSEQAATCDWKNPVCKEANNESTRQLKALLASNSVTEQQILAFQWMQRRKAEGGDALVKAWLAIIKDFRQSL